MRLLSVFILSLFLISCSDNPSTENSIYPVKVGTWQVNSETQSDWVGTKRKSKVDSVTISQAGQQGFSIYTTANTKSFQFIFSFVDSTITKPTHPDFGLDYYIGVPTGPDYQRTILEATSYQGSLNNDRLKIDIKFSYACYEDFLSESDTVTVDLKTKQDSTFKYYQFPTNGFESVINHIVCNEPL